MDPYLGEIRLFAGNFAPVGWAVCDGSLLPISENDALYALLGTTYGGDGQTTFGLPDLRGRVIVSQGNNYPIGSKAGVESVTLLQANLPAHNHTMSVSTGSGTTTSPTNNFLASPVDQTPNQKTILDYVPDNAAGLTVQPLLSNTLTPAGSSLPHENRMPFLCINYIIATAGIYPSSN